MLGGTLRDFLRTETRQAHESLDRLTASMPLSDEGAYAHFLQCQFKPRSALEAAFSKVAPFGLTRPPLQTLLMAQDLLTLGHSIPPSQPAIQLVSSQHALGAAWVVAGSSLGNRSLLAQRRKVSLNTANCFFSDEAMPSYFREVLEVLECGRGALSPEALRDGALHTFGLFEASFAARRHEVAA